ncbi:MAG: hypothetical protein ACHQ4H_02400 [Ktedonobacterales bacterium]
MAAALLLIAAPWQGVPAVRASGTGALAIMPTSGTVGTQVTVVFETNPPVATAYVLAETTTPPAQASCGGTALPISDAPKIVVAATGSTTATFSWPADLTAGPYWLCASPASADQKGAQVWSSEPFTVLGAGPPTTTVAPVGESVGLTTSAPSGGSASPSPPADPLLLAVIGVLLALAIASLATSLLRREHAR